MEFRIALSATKLCVAKIGNRMKFFTLILCAIAFTGCVTMGENALNVMNDEELSYLDNTLKPMLNMTKDEVADFLDEGDITYRITPGLFTYYPFPDTKTSQVRIYFWDDKVIKIRWMKIGRNGFSYDLNAERDETQSE